MEKIREIIRQYIANDILSSGDGYSYADDDSFLRRGIIDSLNVANLVLFVEQSFGVKVEMQEITPNNFDSVSKLATFVQNKKDSSTGNKNKRTFD